MRALVATTQFKIIRKVPAPAAEGRLLRCRYADDRYQTHRTAQAVDLWARASNDRGARLRSDEPAAHRNSRSLLPVRDCQVQAGLREALGTTNTKTFLVPGSGSGAMETAVGNFVRKGTKFLVFANGHFADRVATMGARQGARMTRCEKPWGEIFTAEDAQAAIERDRPEVVVFVQGETSTGAYQSGRAIASAAHSAGALVIADCVTTLGQCPLKQTVVGIYVAYSCAQKGLSCPAGLSPISISPAAWDWIEKRTEDPATWYFDLRLLAKYFDSPHVYHHTPSPPLYYAMHQGLAAIEEEGLRQRFDRHRKAGEQLMTGLVKLGFEPLVKKPEDRLWHPATALCPLSG